MKEQDYKKAILEALFWWQRSEYQYSNEFQQAFKKRQNANEVELFVENSYSKFLTDYSIRRNLRGKGNAPVLSFIGECFSRNGLMENLEKSGDKGEIIDSFINKIKEKDFAKGKKEGKRLTSLVVKTAFLFQPESVPLYDQLAKKSLEKIRKEKINSFSQFLKHFEKQKLEWEEPIRKLLKEQFQFMSIFSEVEIIKNRDDFFVHRTVDKLLWMREKGVV